MDKDLQKTINKIIDMYKDNKYTYGQCIIILDTIRRQIADIAIMK